MSNVSVTAYRGLVLHPTYVRQPRRLLPELFDDSSKNIYPMTRDDILDGEKRIVDYDAVYLENEHLKLTILPELGAKIWSVWDKASGEEIVYVPDVIKPSLIHRPGAWIPGGMEFNFPIGHTVDTMRFVPCHIIETGPDTASVGIRKHDLRTGLQMSIVITLKAGEARFRIDYTAINPTALTHAYMHWTNVGTLAHDDWQFISKAALNYSGNGTASYPISQWGLDTSWLKNRHISSDSFMMGNLDAFFGYYDHRRGVGLAHVTPPDEMIGKKYHTFGRVYRNYWSEACFSDSNLNYTEIQSGRFETQFQYGAIQPGETHRFGETWIPFRNIAGIEWGNDTILFNIKDTTPMLYAAVDTDVELVIDGRSHKHSLAAGQSVTLNDPVSDGATIAILANGKTCAEFSVPYSGRQEPDVKKRVKRELPPHPFKIPTTAADHLKEARLHANGYQYHTAVHHYMQAVQLKPAAHAIRYELADALWHIGDFDGGESELKKLLNTPLAKRAGEKLALRRQAEFEFMEPVRIIPDNACRRVTLAERYAGYGGFEAAETMYRKLLRSDPNNPRVHYGAACLFAYFKNDPRAAVRHMEKARTLAATNDRDYTIAAAEMFRTLGQHARVVKLLDASPAAVRNLSVCQKVLAASLFELGDDTRAWKILSTRRLYNWEGELTHLDNYINCALALCERALSRGNISQAKKRVLSAKRLPPTLGMEQKHMSHCRKGYWEGLVYESAGDGETARAVWRAAIDAMLEEKQKRTSREMGNLWTSWVTDEDAYMILLCAEKLDEPKTCRTVRRFINDLIKTNERYYNLKPSKYLQGALLEIDGDFDAAATCFTDYIRSTPDTRLAKMHLKAVKQGRRRGDIVQKKPRNPSPTNS